MLRGGEVSVLSRGETQAGAGISGGCKPPGMGAGN